MLASMVSGRAIQTMAGDDLGIEWMMKEIRD